MVKVTYNNAVIASLEGGNIVTLQCAGKKMIDDITVSAPEVENSPLPIEVVTEDEMNALLETAEIGSIYKYTGTTGTYENGAIYVIEQVEEEAPTQTYSLTLTNKGNSSHEFMFYGVDTEVYDDLQMLNYNSTVTIDNIKSFVYCYCDYIFVDSSTVLSNCTIEKISNSACKIYPTGDNATATLECKD